jgi:KDO2-lipid IV(A) lauroyltransferase
MSNGRPRPRTPVSHPLPLTSAKVWSTWVVVALGWLIARLPLRGVVAAGRGLGWLGYYFASNRRHIADVNLALCFPNLNDSERIRLTKQVFQHVAVGALETTVTWLNPGRELAARVTIKGAEHLREAQRQQRGVLLLGGHFTSIDIVSQAMSRAVDLDVMYRKNKNPVWEWLQVRGRKRYHDGVIERSDTRNTLRKLKAGHTLWYAADQDYGAKHSVFAPFFGVRAASITAPARLARFNQSPALFIEITRDWQALTWEVTIGQPLAGYPSGDDVADATRLNALVEAAVRRHPEQYLWVHRRFKTRPPGEERPY